MSTEERKPETPPTRRKPYRTPRLTVHGTLRKLTKLTGPKGGTQNDGGGLPKTRQ